MIEVQKGRKEYNYKCSNCKHKFDEPKIYYTSYENYFGVSSLFPNSTPMELYVCPHCGSEEINEIEERYYNVYMGDPLINYRFKKRKKK